MTEKGTFSYTDWRQIGQVLESHVLEQNMWTAAPTQVLGLGEVGSVGVGEGEPEAWGGGDFM